MSDLLPERESLRRALRWIAEHRAESPATPTAELVKEASRRFDLGPLDEEWLWQALTRPKD